MPTLKKHSENDRVTQAAGIVGGATFLSRILGYVRDMVIASFFGAGLFSDAFIVAFRIPNLLRRLFGEGSLSIAFVPVFTDCLNHDGRDEAYKLVYSAMRFLFIVTSLACLIGIIFAPVIVHLLAYGFTDDPEKYALCVKLTRIMLPYSICLCLVALCMGVLNVLRHFLSPALAPTLLNLSMIGMVMFFAWLSPSMETRILGLASGVLIGGVLQLGLQIPFLIKKGIYFWRRAPFWHPAMKRIFWLMGPVLFGTAVYQINSLVTCMLASLLDQEGSLSYLYYADRLVQFPLGVFAIAIATAVLPTLSHLASVGQMGKLRHTFSHALKLTLFITLPSMVGLIVLGEPIVAILFERGAFDVQATRLTASALLYYSLGLWAFSAVRIFLSTFYAMKDTRTPVKAALVSIAFNIVLGVILMRTMQHNGLALALSLASMLHLGLLAIALRKKMGAMGWRSISISTIRSGICAIIMGVAVWTAAGWIIPAEVVRTMHKLIGLIACILIGVTVYGGLALLFKAPELESVKRLILNRTVSS